MTHVYADLSNPKKIQFYDKSVGVGINNWTWDFGDSSSSHEQNPLHEFVTSDRYVVKLEVSNGYATDSTSYEIGIA
jgi:PKD repeat protein